MLWHNANIYQTLNSNRSLQLLNGFSHCLWTLKNECYDIALYPDAKPYNARPNPIPNIDEATLKMEQEHLCTIGVLKKMNQSEWGSPKFIIPKKDGIVQFISDFREQNETIK
jgi:hypothetical protein